MIRRLSLLARPPIGGIYAHLDGSSHYFYRDDADFPESGIVGANDLTIQAWVRPDSVNTTKGILAKWQNASGKRRIPPAKEAQRGEGTGLDP